VVYLNPGSGPEIDVQQTSCQETRQEILDQLDRLLASPHFTRSTRLKRFLRYCIDQTLAGSADILKEQVVGTEVFDRDANYDPRLDPIVRVEARRLRTKLRAYYAAEGSAETLEIEFPTGSYAPVFRRIASREPAPAIEAGIASIPQPPVPVALDTQERAGELSLAVLPFLNLADGPAASQSFEQDYFNDGLAEELIHLLTRVEGLRILSWHSASRLRGQDHDYRSILDQLNVQVVLRGRVRRTADRVRVTVQLIDTGSGAYLWSELYERPMQDIFVLQQQISGSIVETLRRSLQPALAVPSEDNPTLPAPDVAAERLADGPAIRSTPAHSEERVATMSAECHNLCLQGRFHGNRRTLEGLRKSVACFEQAVAVDPSSAIAYAGLADAYSLLADYGGAPIRELLPKAEAAAQTALTLDPDLAEANVALAYLRSMFQWRWVEAEQLYRRAIASNPGYSRAHHWYGGDLLAPLSRLPEAREQLAIAAKLDPLSQIIREGVGLTWMFARQFDQALHMYEEVIELDPMFYKAYGSKGRVLCLQGHYDEALEAFAQARMLSPQAPSVLGAMGQTLALAGRVEEARACLEELHRLVEPQRIPALCFAVLHLGLAVGDAAHREQEFQQVFAWLERASEAREGGATLINVHPLYDPLRSDARFQRLVQTMGLA
jgi:serine/threonine-protein kinase